MTQLWQTQELPTPMPSIDLEVEYGDRRASAHLPVNASPETIQVAGAWLKELFSQWEVR